MSAFRQYTSEECTGKDGYPPAWHETIKHAVREQAGHRCIRCQHPYVKGAGAWSPCDERCTHGGPLRIDGREIPAISEGFVVGMVVEAAWRILTVHHLDGDKGNCRWWNLTSLCQRCHLEIQCKVHMDRRWLKPHSEWFKPYVAGYYAWTFLGEDLSRDEVMARLDELLDLEERQLGLDVAA